MKNKNTDEHDEFLVARAKPGFTPVEATAYLHKAFPDVGCWLYLHMPFNMGARAVSQMIGSEYMASGNMGKWTWERIPMSYPRLYMWEDHIRRSKYAYTWLGAIRVKHADGKEFILFSYVSHRDEIGNHFLTSTNDAALLRRFFKEAARRYDPKSPKVARILVINGRDIEIDCTAPEEPIVLPNHLLEDVESQVHAFFSEPHVFKRLGVRHQRGFLFVGPPGTGKTMMMRRLIRGCHKKYKVRFVSLNINKKLDEAELARAFDVAEAQAPAVLLLEDMDSLMRETMISRSMFLSLLDGLKSNKGILIIGSSNNPEIIDPALVHRPSRFDRVWAFPLPDKVLRRQYLSHHFKDTPDAVIEAIVDQTGDWSYAYLNELRTTAAIVAVSQGQEEVTSSVLEEATKTLASQFNAGRKSYAAPPKEDGLGFKVA